MKRLIVLFCLMVPAAFATNWTTPAPTPAGATSNSSAQNSNSNSNDIANANANTNDNKNSNYNSSNTTNNNFNLNESRVGVTTVVENALGQGQDQAQYQLQSQNSTSSSNGNTTATSVSINETVNYEARRIPVTSAYAASLTSGYDTCLGSASGGLQTGVVGFSAGKTTIDKNCVMIKQVQLLTQMGFVSAACFRARSGKEGAEIDAAMAKAGIDCANLPQPPVPVAPAIDTSNFVTREELMEREKRIFQRSFK